MKEMYTKPVSELEKFGVVEIMTTSTDEPELGDGDLPPIFD